MNDAVMSMGRVEVDNLADVGSVMPHLGATFRYDPLPADLGVGGAGGASPMGTVRPPTD